MLNVQSSNFYVVKNSIDSNFRLEILLTLHTQFLTMKCSFLDVCRVHDKTIMGQLHPCRATGKIIVF